MSERIYIYIYIYIYSIYRGHPVICDLIHLLCLTVSNKLNLNTTVWKALNSMTCVACVLCTVQAYTLWLPNDGFFENRNMLEQPL